MKAAGLNTLSFEGHDVRMVLMDDQPWWYAKDVCDVLGLTNPTVVLKGLDEDERMTLSSTEGHSGKRGGPRSQALINEFGLYSLVLRSRKPAAKAFKRWITHEIIPAIRKTGTYSIPETPKAPRAPRLSTKDMVERYAELTQGVMSMYERAMAVEADRIELEKQRAERDRLRDERIEALQRGQAALFKRTEGKGAPVSAEKPEPQDPTKKTLKLYGED